MKHIIDSLRFTADSYLSKPVNLTLIRNKVPQIETALGVWWNSDDTVIVMVL